MYHYPDDVIKEKDGSARLGFTYEFADGKLTFNSDLPTDFTQDNLLEVVEVYKLFWLDARENYRVSIRESYLKNHKSVQTDRKSHKYFVDSGGDPFSITAWRKWESDRIYK